MLSNHENSCPELLNILAHGRDLSAEQAGTAFRELMTGSWNPAQIGALLMGLGEQPAHRGHQGRGLDRLAQTLGGAERQALRAGRGVGHRGDHAYPRAARGLLELDEQVAAVSVRKQQVQDDHVVAGGVERAAGGDQRLGDIDLSSGSAERVRGGFRVSARKRFVSGSPGADLFVTALFYVRG